MLHYGLLVLLALTIVASLKAVGIILVIAMLIGPGATAYLLTDSFERMLVIATGVALTSAADRHNRQLPRRWRDRRLHRADRNHCSSSLAFLFAPKGGCSCATLRQIPKYQPA